MNASPLKILAVDDEQLLLWALERACEGRALNITTANSNQQALAEIELCLFDLFLIDFDLRDPNRLELLKAIDQRCPYVPIIFMTTADMNSCELNDAIRAARKQGAWHLMEKPFSLDRMTSFIEVIFQDRDNVKLCVNNLSHNYDHEKRLKFRHPHVQKVDMSYSLVVDGEEKKISAAGILTDISDSGLGLLSHSPLNRDLVLKFEEEQIRHCGIVAWSCRLDTTTCRAGIRLY